MLALPLLGEQLSLFQYFVIVAMILATYMLIFRVKGQKNPSADGNKYKYMIVFYSFLSAIGAIVGKFLLITMNPFTFLILSGIFMSVSYVVLI